jgi:hypothetical protein
LPPRTTTWPDDLDRPPGARNNRWGGGGCLPWQVSTTVTTLIATAGTPDTNARLVDLEIAVLGTGSL